MMNNNNNKSNLDHNKVLAITKGFVYPHNSKLYMKKNFNVGDKTSL